jgi:hypothetical protein
VTSTGTNSCSPDFLQVAIDVSGDGRLPLPPYEPNIDSGLFNITLFLTSYLTGLNLTISNGTKAGWWLRNSTESWEFGCDQSSGSGFQDAGCQEVMLQEPGSTVKHVNWVWPDCLIGNGLLNSGNCGNGQEYAQSCLEGTARGAYNVSLHPPCHAQLTPTDFDNQISIHQSFRLNGTQYYTIFDLPIEVTNSIPRDTQQSSSKARPFCTLRNNPLLSPAQTNSSVTTLPYQPYLGGNASVSGSGSNSNSGSSPSSTSSLGIGTSSGAFFAGPWRSFIEQLP